MIDTKYSQHYDKIVEFLYEDNDTISKLLIDYYQEYLKKIKNKKSKQTMDLIMNEYTNQTGFYNYIQQYFNPNQNNELVDNYDKVMKKVRKLYQEFMEEQQKTIKNTRWL